MFVLHAVKLWEYGDPLGQAADAKSPHVTEEED
jgi:hypothetical protein